MKKFTKLMLAMAIPAAMLAGNANATLITQWDYENQFGFDSWTSTTGVNPAVSTSSNANANFGGSGGSPFTGPLVANPVFGNSLSLVWGVPTTGGQSSFVLTPGNGAQGGVVTTNGGYVPDLTLTHNNFPITGSHLATAVLQGSLLLQAKTGGSVQLPPITASFNINFEETPNQTGTCVVTPGAPCPDIFVIGTGSSPLTNIFLASIDDYSYYLDLNTLGLSGLSSAACSAAGATPASSAPYCFGFTTQEGASSSFNLEYRIRGVLNPIPEPGTLALLGLSLAGLGFGQYRRRK